MYPQVWRQAIEEGRIARVAAATGKNFILMEVVFSRRNSRPEKLMSIDCCDKGVETDSYCRQILKRVQIRWQRAKDRAIVVTALQLREPWNKVMAVDSVLWCERPFYSPILSAQHDNRETPTHLNANVIRI